MPIPSPFLDLICQSATAVSSRCQETSRRKPQPKERCQQQVPGNLRKAPTLTKSLLEFAQAILPAHVQKPPHEALQSDMFRIQWNRALPVQLLTWFLPQPTLVPSSPCPKALPLPTGYGDRLPQRGDYIEGITANPTSESSTKEFLSNIITLGETAVPCTPWH